MRTILLIALAALSAACASQPSALSSHVANAASAHPLCVRAEAGNVWWSYHEWSEPHAVWALPGRGQVSDLRVDARDSLNGFDDALGYRVTFRRDGQAYEGYLDENHRPVGDLAPLRTLAGRAARPVSASHE